MAIENKRMLQRYGTYSQYEANKSNILPNEFISVTEDSPDTPDGSALYFKNGTNEPERILTNVDRTALENQIDTKLDNSAEAVGFSNLTTEVRDTIQNKEDSDNKKAFITDANKRSNIQFPTIGAITEFTENFVGSSTYSRTVIDNKFSQQSIDTYALVQNLLSTYIQTSEVDNRIMVGYTTFQSPKFGGDVYLYHVRFGGENGICLVIFDTPVCTSGGPVTLGLPFAPANDTACQLFIGGEYKTVQIEQHISQITFSILTGQKASGMFGYRIIHSVG